MNRLRHLSSIRELAQRVNGPGNDVFDTKDWKTESSKMNIALSNFNQEYTKLELSITNTDDDEKITRLRLAIENVKTRP